MRAYVVDNAEHCIFCNAYIPEGRQVCPFCEKKYLENSMEEVNIAIEKENKENC